MMLVCRVWLESETARRPRVSFSAKPRIEDVSRVRGSWILFRLKEEACMHTNISSGVQEYVITPIGRTARAAPRAQVNYYQPQAQRMDH